MEGEYHCPIKYIDVGFVDVRFNKIEIPAVFAVFLVNSYTT